MSQPAASLKKNPIIAVFQWLLKRFFQNTVLCQNTGKGIEGT